MIAARPQCQQNRLGSWIKSRLRPTRVLVFGLTVILVLLVAVTLIGLNRMNQVEDQLAKVVRGHNRQSIMASDMLFVARERSAMLQKIVVTADPFLRDDYYMQMRQMGSRFIATRQQLLELDLYEREKELLARQGKLTSQVGDLQFRIVDLANEERMAEAKALLYDQALPLQEGVVDVLHEFADLQIRDNEALLIESENAFTAAFASMGTLVSGALFVIVLIAIFMTRTVTNITNSLLKSEAQERAIRDNMSDSVVTIDEKGSILSCNPAAEKMFGYSVDDMVGENVSLLMAESDRYPQDKSCDRSYHGSGWSGATAKTRECEGKRKDGSTLPVDISMTSVTVDNRRIVVAILRDITARRQAEQAMQHSRDELEKMVQKRTAELMQANRQLQHMANHDMLTDLPNRVLIMDYLKLISAQSARHKQLTAVLFLDLDGFKQINDTLGHEAGDFVLKKTASRLRHCIREQDSVARIGGDEFLIVLGNLDRKDDVLPLVKRVIKNVTQSIFVGPSKATVGASIGISLYPVDSKRFETLLSQADKAMYGVKKKGKNNFCFYADMNCEAGVRSD